MIKKFIWLSVCALALIIGQPSFACPAEKNPTKHCHCNDIKSSANQLNLSDEQKAKIKTIKSQARVSFKANRDKLKALRQQINTLARAEKIDEAKLDNLISQISKIKSAQLKNHILMRHQIYTLLTDKQKQQYQEIMKQHEQKHS
ncbi:Spy/CpxP family protein refolding chaperone [uncultured Legionella sp.]|uniref:Spy/CpxP family protein refolding chaperone n=1 Tax=uncultured Legionella sp. TaxID=210934 RepID=UPI00261C3F94|nr:Spy/CpxP family protein refolding chaperone [uncultured Legionella sp.]